MKKLVWLIVCLMTMVVSVSSCGENNTDKFKLEINGMVSKESQCVIDKTLQAIDRHFYFHSKYDPSALSILKTKIHIQNDSLVFGEIYFRGRNSFDGGSVGNNLFIFYTNKNGEYFSFIDEYATLVMRIELEPNQKDKNDVLSRYAVKNGILNDETSYEQLLRYTSHRLSEIKDKKYFKKYLDNELKTD